MESNKGRCNKKREPSFGNGKNQRTNRWFNDLYAAVIAKRNCLKKIVSQQPMQENINNFEKHGRQTDKKNAYTK